MRNALAHRPFAYYTRVMALTARQGELPLIHTARGDLRTGQAVVATRQCGASDERCGLPDNFVDTIERSYR